MKGEFKETDIVFRDPTNLVRYDKFVLGDVKKRFPGYGLVSRIKIDKLKTLNWISLLDYW